MQASRIITFAVIVLAVLAAIGGYVWLKHASGPGATQLGRTGAGTAPGGGLVDAKRTEPTVYFRYNGVDAHYGKLARVRLGDHPIPEILDALSCEIVHVAGRRGLCVAADRGVFTTYRARIFDTKDLRVVAEIPLSGLPSRCRVARDGRRAAVTVFLTGHGYDSVDFSTQTILINLDSGAVESDLDTYEVTKDGAVIKAADFNFWGVTFERDSQHFYATLSTAGEHYLVRGDAESHRLVVQRSGVECPSLSPDESRIAFKKRLPSGGPVRWGIAVVDQATGVETVIAEPGSVDDQVEWLDDDRIMYARPAGEEGRSPNTNVWVALADGSGQPERLIENGYSPAVLR